MKRSAYLETTIIGYLAMRNSRDVRVAANQLSTREWWDDHRPDFDIFVSQFVLDECDQGDPTAADERRIYLKNIPVLDMNQAVEQLDMGLRWCGYRLARLESPEPLLPLALELARERGDLLRELGEPNRQPRLVDQVDDPVVAAEAGFVLAILGEASSLNSWLKNFRSQWNDPLSNELAQRIEDLARALE